MVNELKKIELLAPAGGAEQLQAAINFGADAVYLAGQQFGMRAKAANFQTDEIATAVDFAHSQNVKVYVTCNILMHDQDINQLENYFEELAKAKVDAFIVGDMGAISVAKKIAPEIDVHISTQASVANVQAAIAYAKLGARRIILAREMSLDEINSMRKNLDKQGYADSKDNPKALALEAFVHGAMCMSVSGRCLISSYLTGRSANKGLCTQPCRWGYNLEEEKRPGQKFEISEDDFGTYIMNSKDMNMLAHLQDLHNSGLSSLKIEGRNKKALYVASVVNAYRNVLDSIEKNKDVSFAIKKWEPELNKVSHRPYSTGFYFGQAQQSPDYDGYEQECIHCADVLDCKKEGDAFILSVMCRNRFENEQSLEALVPHKDIEKIKVQNLKWITSEKSGGKSVDIANRAKEVYTFDCDYKIPKGSLLRSVSYLRTSRD